MTDADRSARLIPGALVLGLALVLVAPAPALAQGPPTTEEMLSLAASYGMECAADTSMSWEAYICLGYPEQVGGWDVNFSTQPTGVFVFGGGAAQGYAPLWSNAAAMLAAFLSTLCGGSAPELESLVAEVGASSVQPYSGFPPPPGAVWESAELSLGACYLRGSHSAKDYGGGTILHSYSVMGSALLPSPTPTPRPSPSPTPTAPPPTLRSYPPVAPPSHLAETPTPAPTTGEGSPEGVLIGLAVIAGVGAIALTSWAYYRFRRPPSVD